MKDYILSERSVILSEIDSLIIEDSLEENKDLTLEKELPKSNYNEVIEDFKSLLGSLEFTNIPITLYEVKNDNDFIQKQHDILGIDYMVIDIMGSVLKVITNRGKGFLINMDIISPKIYGVIFTTFMPRKLCFNSKDIYKSNELKKVNIYDISHVVKMFYGVECKNIEVLVSLFCKNASKDENALLYNLFQIKDKLNTLLDRHRLMSLINKEFKLIEAISSIEKSGMPFSEDSFKLYIENLNTKYKAAITTNEQVLGSDLTNILDDKEKLLLRLEECGFPTCYDETFLCMMENEELFNLVQAHNTIKKYSQSNLITTNKRLYLDYDSYDSFGNIAPAFEINNLYIKSSKNIVTGVYIDLYYRIFANFSNIDYLIAAVSSNSLAETLAMKIFENNNAISRFNSIALLQGYIEGNFTCDSMYSYLYEKRNCHIPPEDIEILQNLFEEKCPEIIKFVKRFNRDRSKDKRFSISREYSPLHSFIKLTEADIFKSAIIQIYDSISSFNENNKYKINFIGLQKDMIILESDDACLNVAVDILNRKLISSYDYYIERIPAVCNVNSYNTPID